MPSSNVSPSGDGSQAATVALTSAQVLALHSSPATLIAAPGANRTILVARVYAQYDPGVTPYADHLGNLVVYTGSNMNLPMGATAGFWDQAVKMYKDYGYTSVPTDVVSGIVNKPLLVRNDTADPTGGDGTLTFSITYRVVDV